MGLIVEGHRVIVTPVRTVVHVETIEELKEELHNIIKDFRKTSNRETEYTFYFESIPIRYRISWHQQAFWDSFDYPTLRFEKTCMYFEIDRSLSRDYSKTEELVHEIAVKIMMHLPLLKAKAVVEE